MKHAIKSLSAASMIVITLFVGSAQATDSGVPPAVPAVSLDDDALSSVLGRKATISNYSWCGRNSIAAAVAFPGKKVSQGIVLYTRAQGVSKAHAELVVEEGNLVPGGLPGEKFTSIDTSSVLCRAGTATFIGSSERGNKTEFGVYRAIMGSNNTVVAVSVFRDGDLDQAGMPVAKPVSVRTDSSDIITVEPANSGGKALYLKEPDFSDPMRLETAAAISSYGMYAGRVWYCEAGQFKQFRPGWKLPRQIAAANGSVCPKQLALGGPGVDDALIVYQGVYGGIYVVNVPTRTTQVLVAPNAELASGVPLGQVTEIKIGSTFLGVIAEVGGEQRVAKYSLATGQLLGWTTTATIGKPGQFSGLAFHEGRVTFRLTETTRQGETNTLYNF